jgi:transposase
MSKIEVMTGPERRRRWSDEQKRTILAEAFGPGGVVSEVARRSGLCTGQIYRWRDNLRRAEQGFSRVIVAAPDDSERPGLAPIEIKSGDVHIRVGATAPAALVASIIKALAGR